MATQHSPEIVRAGLRFPFDDATPAPGELIEVAPGVRWWRAPMPGSLQHINGWLLDDGAGYAAVDTGPKTDTAIAAWPAMLDGRALTRIICTHFHPDHSGLAGRLSREFDAPVVMTRAEWLTLRVAHADAREEVPDEMPVFWRAAGWSAAQIAAASKRGWSFFRTWVSRPPLGYRRIAEGDMLEIGGRAWRVLTGNGHSPEHACLLDERARVLIAGDQVLPRISSNVSLGADESEGDPLGDWLTSIAKLRKLDGDVLVLPGHGEPFHGLHTRLDALASEHRERLDALHAWLGEPRRAVDCFAALFRRPIDAAVLGLATGEALAHLRRLELEGAATREARDGVWWFVAT